MSDVSYMEISTYYEKNRRADVVRTVGLNEKNFFGVRFSIDSNVLGIEWYPEHSETWVENAAENYVLGIKDYTG